MSSELATTNQSPTTEQILATVVQGATPESAQTVREILALMKEQRDDDAKRAFAAAFSEMQAEMPNVQATHPVQNKDGSLRYVFAPYEDLMRQVAPVLKKNGFGISFNGRVDGDRFVAICTLTHRLGHFRTNESAMRISGPPGATVTQADGATQTYAKRFALIDCLNIVVSKQDNDGRGDDPNYIGDTLNEIEVDEVRKRVKETNSNEAKLLKWLGVSKYEDIPAARLAEVHAVLDNKAKGH